MEQINILMLGGRKSGKSTVLAAIFDQANNKFLKAEAQLSLLLDAESLEPIEDKVSIAKASLRNELGVPFIMKGIGTQDIDKYSFELGIKSEPPILKLTFFDTAGGRMGSLEEDMKHIGVSLGDCSAAVLAIDAVELMEGKNILTRSNEKRNRPLIAQQHVAKWLQSNSKQKRLLCIVPIKTETYLRDRPGIDINKESLQLIDQIKTDYWSMFETLKQDSNNTAVVITPVQTFGNVIFHHYEEVDNGYPKEFWQTVKGTKTEFQNSRDYSPLDCEQPLLHILNFFMLRYVEINKSKREKTSLEELSEWLFGKSITDALENTFGQSSLFTSAVLKLSKHVKLNAPFSIVQGEELFRPKSDIFDLLFNKQ